MKLRVHVLAAALVLAVATLAGAQSTSPVDPLARPLLDLSGVTYAGSFRFPAADGAGGWLSYGARALALSPDGKALHVSCVYDSNGFATIEIPPIGGMARILTPCRAHLNRADIAAVHPDPAAYAPTFGGILDLGGGAFVASGYISYDADGGASRSHFKLTGNGATVAGPFAGTVSPGLVRSQMAMIPPDWRALMGGAAYATTGYDSIISRGSYGLGLAVFDPATVTADGFPMKLLIGCRHTDPGCNTYQNDAVGKDRYQGAEQFATAFLAPGTRTLVSVEREADGPACYGYATTDPTKHGTPYPGPGYDAQHVVYCYSLERIDSSDGKGPKGYPYRLVAKLYDMRDVVGPAKRQPWEIRPYAVATLPGFGAITTVQSGAFDPLTGRVYVVQNNSDLSKNPDRTVVDVLAGFPTASSTPAPPVATDCKPGTPSKISDDAATAACVRQADGTGTKTITEQWTRLGDVPATNGGAACSPIPYTIPRVEACTPSPLPTPAPYQCEIVSLGKPYADGDLLLSRVRCDTNGKAPALPVGTKFTIPRP